MVEKFLYRVECLLSELLASVRSRKQYDNIFLGRKMHEDDCMLTQSSALNNPLIKRPYRIVPTGWEKPQYFACNICQGNINNNYS